MLTVKEAEENNELLNEMMTMSNFNNNDTEWEKYKLFVVKTLESLENKISTLERENAELKLKFTTEVSQIKLTFKFYAGVFTIITSVIVSVLTGYLTDYLTKNDAEDKQFITKTIIEQIQKNNDSIINKIEEKHSPQLQIPQQPIPQKYQIEYKEGYVRH